MIIHSLSQLDPEEYYTWNDYKMWNFKERVELIMGKIFPMSPGA